jgi:hypothetical protein
MTAATPGRRRAHRRTRPRTLLVAFLELLAMSGLAITQPILDVFGRAPDVFIAAGAGRADLWWFAIAVAVVPALVLVTVEVAVAAVAGELARRQVHLAALGGLALLLALRVLRLTLGWHGIVLFVAACSVALVFMGFRNRQVWLEQWLAFASLGPAAFAVLFLFSSPASSLAAAEPAEAREAVEVVSVDAARPPVVMLILDELPVRSLLATGGGLDAERYPGFGAFAAESTWFRAVTSVASHTSVAVPALLTGQYPAAEEQAPAAADHPDNVFRLLGNVYRFNVSELDTQLCVVPRCDRDDPENAPSITTTSGGAPDAGGGGDPDAGASALFDLLDRAREEYGNMVALDDVEVLPTIGAEELTGVSTTTASTTSTTDAVPVSAPSVPPTTIARGFDKLPSVQPKRFRDWLERIDGDVETPQLSVLHLTMPHGPFYLDADGNAYQIPDGPMQLVGSAGGDWSEDPGAGVSARQRHLLQVRYVDTLITALRARLVEVGIWDDALVIVTADHGAAFEAGGTFRDWRASDQTDLVGVPLFVRGPGFAEGKVDDRPVQSVDVAATIEQVAEVDAPWTIDGASLLALPAAPRTEHPFGAISGTSYEYTTITVGDHLDRLLASAPAAGTDGGDDLTILRAGPRGELVGHELAAFTVAEPAGSVVQEFPAAGLPTVDGRVGAFIVGYVEGGEPGAVIAVAVDGRIAATATTFRENEHDARFALLVPPAWLLDAPSHDTEFFLVLDDGTLAPLDR